MPSREQRDGNLCQGFRELPAERDPGELIYDRHKIEKTYLSRYIPDVGRLGLSVFFILAFVRPGKKLHWHDPGIFFFC